MSLPCTLYIHGGISVSFVVAFTRKSIGLDTGSNVYRVAHKNVPDLCAKQNDNNQ